MEKRKASSERLEVKLRGMTQELANGLPSLEHVGNTIWYGGIHHHFTFIIRDYKIHRFMDGVTQVIECL